MTPDEIASGLEEEAAKPENAHRRDRIMGVVDRLRAKAAANQPTATGRPGEIGSAGPLPPEVRPPGYLESMRGGKDPNPSGPISEPVPQSIPERLKAGAQRLGAGLTDAATLANRAVDTATMGLYGNAVNRLSRGQFNEDQARVEAQHPMLAGAADAAGYLAPTGAPGAAGRIAGEGADALIHAMMRRQAPKLAAGRAAIKTLGGAAAGAVAGGAVGAGEEAGHRTSDAFALPSRQDLEATGEAAVSGAKTGGVVGGGMGAVSGLAAEGARAYRNANGDVQALHRQGLEPGPIPGRPIIRQDRPILTQLPGRGQPEIIGNSTPDTRTAAARTSGDYIMNDMREREVASGKRFGQLSGDIISSEGTKPAPFKHLVRNVDDALTDQSLSDATRKALTDVRSKFAPYLPKPNPQLQHVEQLMQSASPEVRGRLEAIRSQLLRTQEPPKPFTVADLNEVRKYIDTKVSSGEIKKDDIEFLHVSEAARRTLDSVSPRFAALNQAQHGVMSGFEERRALLGQTIKNPRGPAAKERVSRAVARRIRESGEETSFAGSGRKTSYEGTGEPGAGSAAERLGQLGAPPTLPGTPVPPEPSYKAHLDVPRLQLAQENAQLNTSKMLSGARAAGERGLILRAIQYAPERVFYPLGRRLGEAEVGTKPIAADALTRALRDRGKKKKQEM